MKLHITENVDKIIDGYMMVPIVYGKINVDNIPSNSAEEIIIDNIGHISFGEVIEFLGMVLSKLRLGGSIIINGTDINTVCQKVLQGYTTTEELNSTVVNNRGLYGLEDIVKHVKGYKLKLESVKFIGENYEIRAVRSHQN